jgi:hypothetical protein
MDGSDAERRRQARRGFLTTGFGGLGSAALASLLARDGLLADMPAPRGTGGSLAVLHHPPRAERAILVFLMGGPSQMDLYDPKPRLVALHGQPPPQELLERVRFAFLDKNTATLWGSPRRFRPAGACGMELSELLPHLATRADDICLVRSMFTDSFNHSPAETLAIAGSQMLGRPSIGSWLDYGLGTIADDLPGYVVLTSGRLPQPSPYYWSQGFLPPQHQGVPFRSTGSPVLDLAPPVRLPTALGRAQQETLRRLNEARFATLHDPETAARIAAYELAFRMQSSAPELIDLAGETSATRAAYGLDRDEGDLLPAGARAGGKGMFHTFASHCLLARRLVERGVRFVTLVHTSWDQHDKLDEQLAFNCRMADRPLAALVADLKARGLLDSTLVVCMGEFGRTPLGENRKEWDAPTGRDHHPSAFSLWLAGGGIRGGQVVGATDELGWSVIEDPVHVHDLHATMLHLFGIDHRRLTYRHQGRDFRLTDVHGRVVEKLLA